MSVIMTFRAAGDPDELERRAAQNPEAMRSIADRAKEHGLIAHRFYGTDGQIMVVDEWPDPESFQRFFSSVEDQVAPMMAAGGITEEPAVSFWRKLDTHDDYGWE